MKILYNQRQAELLDSGYEEGLREVVDYSFIKNKTKKRSERIIEHPSVSNVHHDELRFCHPNNARARIMNATFKELKDTLNCWVPDNIDEKWKSEKVFLTEKNTTNILKKCLMKGSENIDDMEIITVFKQGIDFEEQSDVCRFCYKVALFDKKNQLFLLRTGGNKKGATEWGYTKEIDVHSYDPEWFVDRSTLLAYRSFWADLKDIINNI
jgi:hypothetical protein